MKSLDVFPNGRQADIITMLLHAKAYIEAGSRREVAICWTSGESSESIPQMDLVRFLKYLTSYVPGSQKCQE